MAFLPSYVGTLQRRLLIFCPVNANPFGASEPALPCLCAQPEAALPSLPRFLPALPGVQNWAHSKILVQIFFLGLFSNVVVFGGQEACEENKKEDLGRSFFVRRSVRRRSATAACKMG